MTERPALALFAHATQLAGLFDPHHDTGAPRTKRREHEDEHQDDDEETT